MGTNLIFSTKGLPKKPVWSILVVVILAPIMCFICLPSGFAIIISGFIIGICIFAFVQINYAKKSYIDIYEDKISGVATISMTTIFFELRYNEIIRLDRQDGVVRIHVQNGCYIVNAPNCEQKVINLIEERRRMISIEK